MEVFIWWIGVFTLAFGGTGLLALIVAWGIEEVLRLAGFSKALLDAYARLQTEKMHDKQLRG